MAKKDFDEYYEQVANEYAEMLDSLREMEQLAEDKVVNPDKVEEIRKAVEPLKNNYMTLSWVMFLLNQPVKKKKVERYRNQQKNKIRKIDPNKERSPISVHKENLKIINDLKNTEL